MGPGPKITPLPTSTEIIRMHRIQQQKLCYFIFYKTYMPRYLNIGGVALTLSFAYAIILGWKVLKRKTPDEERGTLTWAGWELESLGYEPIFGRQSRPSPVVLPYFIDGMLAYFPLLNFINVPNWF